MQIRFDEGYQFGLGVFETIAVERNRPVFLERHLERMRRSMRYLGIHQDVNREAVKAYLDGHPMEHGVLKILVSDKNLIYTDKENPYTPQRYEKGFRMDFSNVRRNETSPLTYHKTMNYGDCMIEKRKAVQRGLDEVIFLNTRGELCEGTATNIFFVRQGILYTPKLSSGLLPGILRQYVIERYMVQEAVVSPEEILDVEECFVTNSLMGIMPVTRLAGVNFNKGSVTERLIQNYRTDISKI